MSICALSDAFVGGMSQQSPEKGLRPFSVASLLATGVSNTMSTTLVVGEQDSVTQKLAAAASSTMASTLTMVNKPKPKGEPQSAAENTSLPSPSHDDSEPVTKKPFVDISELRETLTDEERLESFRNFLGKLDRVQGRFERYLNFLLRTQEIVDLPQGEANHQTNLLIELHQDFFDCPPGQRLAITSQGALTSLEGHLRSLATKSGSGRHSLDLLLPVFEEVYRKIQFKHDQWKRLHLQTTSLNSLLCTLC